MAIDLTQFNKQAKNKRAENQQFFERLKKQKPNDLDEKTHQLHVTFKHNIFLYKNNKDHYRHPHWHFHSH